MSQESPTDSRLRISRRAALAGVAAVGALSTTPIGLGRARAATEFDQLRQKRVQGLVGGSIDPSDPDYAAKLGGMDSAAAALISSMDTSADRTALWSDAPMPDITNVALSYGRIQTIALAWATEGTGQYGDAQLADQLASGLKFLHDNGYNGTLAEVGNWWFWEIGIPKQLGDIYSMLYDHVAAADLADAMTAVAHFVPDPNYRYAAKSIIETGANRSDKAIATVLRGILSADADVVVLGRDALSDVEGGGVNSLFSYVTSGDGFYTDGSFIQHGYLPYIGTYGNVALSGVADLFALLGGSSWDITDPNKSVILDSVQASFEPFMRNGRMSDSVRGRSVARQAERDYNDGFGPISTILLLATGVLDPYAGLYKRLAKGWIQRCTDVDYLSTASIPQIQRAKTVLGDDSVEAAPEATGVVQLAAQERTVHRAKSWAFTVATSSSRIGRYEWGNGENRFGWYQGDGMTYLYRDDDPSHYSDDYWPTVDPYLLPGVTATDAVRDSSGADGFDIPRGTQAWAGGTALDATWATIGMDHKNYDGSLVAKKSWFCLPDGVVALGAGITGTGGHRVRTAIENRNQHDASTTTVTVNGQPTKISNGWSATWHSPSAIEVPKMGSVEFPQGGAVHGALARRTGTWYAIDTGADTGGTKDEVSNSFLSLWFDHGIDPTNATYAYRLLPDGGRATRLLVVANTSIVQAIRVPSQRLWLGNFFAAGTAADVHADGPAALAVKSDGPKTKIAVSDPSRTAKTVTVTLAGIDATKVVTADDGVQVITFDPLMVQVTPAGGKTYVVTVTD